MVRNDEQPAGLWRELSAGTWNYSLPLHTCICNFTACYASIQNCPQQRKQFHTADRRQHIFPYSSVCKRNSNQWACIYSRLFRSNLQQQRNNLHQRNYNQAGSSVWRRVQLHTNLYTECFNAPEYGYFIVKDTTFIMYEVSPPTPTSGTLQVGIDTPYGLVTSGSAQVPMFTMVDASGFYQLGAQGVV